MTARIKFAAGLGGAALLAAAASAVFAQSTGSGPASLGPASSEPTDLQPTGAWDLQQAAESCYIVREFASGGRTMRLRIQSYGEETPYHIALIGDGLPLRNQRTEAVQLSFGPHADSDGTTALGLLGKSADNRPMLVVAGLPARPVNTFGWIYTGAGLSIRFGEPVSPEQDTLLVDTVDMDPVTLRVGPMDEQFARLDECTRNLENGWHAAAAGESPAVSAPQLLNPKETNWHTKYPENLSLNRISGLVEMRMTVDEKGVAHDCVVQSSLWAKQFGEIACANFERWRRFEPAKDAAGKPVPALYRAAVLYAIYNWG